MAYICQDLLVPLDLISRDLYILGTLPSRDVPQYCRRWFRATSLVRGFRFAISCYFAEQLHLKRECVVLNIVLTLGRAGT